MQAQPFEDTSAMFFDPIGARFGLPCPCEMQQVTPLSTWREGFEGALEVGFFAESVKQFLRLLHRIGGLLGRLESRAFECDSKRDQVHQSGSKFFDVRTGRDLHQSSGLGIWSRLFEDPLRVGQPSPLEEAQRAEIFQGGDDGDVFAFEAIARNTPLDFFDQARVEHQLAQHLEFFAPGVNFAFRGTTEPTAPAPLAEIVVNRQGLDRHGVTMELRGVRLGSVLDVIIPWITISTSP